jgi:hypothetical protein
MARIAFLATAPAQGNTPPSMTDPRSAPGLTRRKLLAGLGAAVLWPKDRLFAQAGPEAGVQPNDPILARPLLDRKLVLTHNMSFPIPRGAAEMDLRAYDPTGTAACIGGLNLTAPLILYNLPEKIARLPAESIQIDNPEYLAYLDAYAEHEVRTAKLLGVDGFECYYPPGMSRGVAKIPRTMIPKYVAAADRLDLDFFVSLDLCHFRPVPGAKTQAERLDFYARTILDVIDAPATRDSKHWLRTPDGRMIFFTWNPFPISQGVENELDLLQGDIRGNVRKVAQGFADLEKRLGRPCAFVYRNFRPIPEYVDALLDYFPALTGWVQTSLPQDVADWNSEIARCKTRGRVFCQNAYPDFYMSKVTLTSGPHHQITDTRDLHGRPPADFVRYHLAGGLSQNFRFHLEQAADENLTLIDVPTWNDYLEGHHLSPELNHDFGFALLLLYYKKIWNGLTPAQAIDRDTAIVFYKKHARNARPLYFDVPIARMEWGGIEPADWEKLEADDDHIEIVTLLTQPAELSFRGRKIGDVGAGLVSTVLPLSPGQVSVGVARAGQSVIDFTAPEWITDAPYRYDRFTVTFSSQSDELYRQVFGPDAKRVYLNEYAEGPDGVPNWKKRYDFSRLTPLGPAPT